MKIHPAQQNSLEWLKARAGIPTASEFDNLLTPKFEPRTGEMPKTYLARKVAEAWIGGPLPGFNTIDMDFGHILEEEAVPTFEIETGISVQRVGLCTTDDGRIGCSPDGLIGDDSGIECKCPADQTHVKYLLAGVLPPEYAVQVYGAMYVTGRFEWKFMSYRRGFPPLILTVPRDELIVDIIDETIRNFLVKFDAAMKRLEEINGGPKIQKKPKLLEPEPEPTVDVIP